LDAEPGPELLPALPEELRKALILLYIQRGSDPGFSDVAYGPFLPPFQ
jgi:hypothetical protein